MDAGYGRLLKQKIRQQTEQWLQTGENMDIWMGNSTETLTVSTRRILITQWVGEANKILMDEKYDGFRKNCFDKTGCNLTADGSDDHLVKPEGLHDYKVIPPLDTPGTNQEIVEPEAEDPPDDVITPDSDDEDLDEEEILEPLESDNVTDRLVS